MNEESPPIASGPSDQPYDFHDEKFVTWWLNSLYLFSDNDQMAIASLLHDAIHAPKAAHEIEAFLEIRAQGIEETQGQLDQSTRQTDASGGGAGGIVRPVMQLWRASPWTAALGLGALGFFLAKGLWRVVSEGYRLIF